MNLYQESAKIKQSFLLKLFSNQYNLLIKLLIVVKIIKYCEVRITVDALPVVLSSIPLKMCKQLLHLYKNLLALASKGYQIFPQYLINNKRVTI